MGTLSLQLGMALMTTTIVVSGITMNATDILASAKNTASTANIHQLSTALELYYMDHNAYPEATNGTQLVNTLFDEGYIRSKPLDASVFQYKQKAGGSDYSLSKR